MGSLPDFFSLCPDERFIYPKNIKMKSKSEKAVKTLCKG
jgi:hypothetical protein